MTEKRKKDPRTYPPFPLCLSFKLSLPSELLLLVSSRSPFMEFAFLSLPSLRFLLSRSLSPEGSWIDVSVVLTDLLDTDGWWDVAVELDVTLGAPFLER